ncbi:MAG TPA: glycoside hydrolase family 3 N-terminal domain-containing protein [Gaiellaceae bacterium]|jgi:beta-N-acetylhexosaminidase|nr:glycoside hydrolase family 3 N-terminal domain-containing protein [Gaiellaceae bacterium]
MSAAACVLPSFPGTAPPDWIRRFLAEGGRGILLFADNVGNLPALAAALRAEREDVLLALDEEGGDVTRLEWREGSSYPSAAALGALDDPALTEEVAAAIAAGLAAAGVNWNFAPVADVNVPANPVIGVRAFGSEAALVARHVAAAVRGTQRLGVAACAKHFPGHGATVEDSHLSLPALVGPVEAGLEPFRAAIGAGVASIMTAHVKVHDDAATLDPQVVAGLLRRGLGFDGAVIADALEMKGVSARHDVADAAVLALEAGVDAVIVGHDLGEAEVKRIVAALAARVRPGRLAEASARMEALAALAVPRPAEVDRDAALAAAARALRVAGTIALPAEPRVVELRPRANVAAGEAEHGIAQVVVREGETVPPADVYVVRDVHRHPWMEAADRAGAVVVETGLPVWRPQRAAAHLTTLGGGRAALDAALVLLEPRVPA